MIYKISMLSMILAQAANAASSDSGPCEEKLETKTARRKGKAVAGRSSVSATTSSKLQNPPSFSTLWQAVQSAGYPRKVTKLYRDDQSQLDFEKKDVLEKDYDDTEHYLRIKYLNGDQKPQLKESAFPYKIKETAGEEIVQLVLWLPDWNWSQIVEVAPADSELCSVRIKKNILPTLRGLVEELHGHGAVADEDILMYVHFKNKEALPNLPNIQVCIRTRSHEVLSTQAPDLRSNQFISGQDGYSGFNKTLLTKHPLEYKMVENFTNKRNGRTLDVPLIPAAALEKANHIVPCYNQQVNRFFRRHKNIDFEELQYGKDFVYALHGTKHTITNKDKVVIPVWDLIKRHGLRETGDAGACGPGIYCARSAGLCSNSSRGGNYPRGNPEFTTIQYGTDMKKKGPITRIVVALVMNPQKYRAVEKTSKIECEDWILPRAEDTLIVDMLEVDTKHISELVLKFDDSELARDTGVKKVICPDGNDKRRNLLMMDLLRGGLMKTLRSIEKPDTKPNLNDCRIRLGTLLEVVAEAEHIEDEEPSEDSIEQKQEEKQTERQDLDENEDPSDKPSERRRRRLGERPIDRLMDEINACS